MYGTIKFTVIIVIFSVCVCVFVFVCVCVCLCVCVCAAIIANFTDNIELIVIHFTHERRKQNSYLASNCNEEFLLYRRFLYDIILCASDGQQRVRSPRTGFYICDRILCYNHVHSCRASIVTISGHKDVV